ncbi:unnamed protein product [Protopolystoma xenopodis]|uniref:Uncharacterized protein n=1 Tax=Protopolystoma xenopodis TaxID=117903 RepID=A0A3S5B1T2_9PLAT|nr:unnamed protein product [Protopolystoma xenopodis]
MGNSRHDLDIFSDYSCTRSVDWCRWPVCQRYFQLAELCTQANQSRLDNCLKPDSGSAQSVDSSDSLETRMQQLRCPHGEYGCHKAHAGPEFTEVIFLPDWLVRVCYDSLGVAGVS